MFSFSVVRQGSSSFGKGFFFWVHKMKLVGLWKVFRTPIYTVCDKVWQNFPLYVTQSYYGLAHSVKVHMSSLKVLVPP